MNLKVFFNFTNNDFYVIGCYEAIHYHIRIYTQINTTENLNYIILLKTIKNSSNDIKLC